MFVLTGCGRLVVGFQQELYYQETGLTVYRYAAFEIYQRNVHYLMRIVWKCESEIRLITYNDEDNVCNPLLKLNPGQGR